MSKQVAVIKTFERGFKSSKRSHRFLSARIRREIDAHLKSQLTVQLDMWQDFSQQKSTRFSNVVVDGCPKKLL
jgi:hypothetical protein